MRTTRTLVAALATIALAAPAAQAQPTDVHSPQAHAATTIQKRQDLRSADAIDASVNPSVHAVNAPGATAADSASVVGPAPARPVTATPADDGGIDWQTIAIGIAGSLVAVGGLGLMLGRRNRQTQRVRAAV
jgi:hypothetical protein